MRDRFYGDNRDLVKWGVLLQLARKYAVTRIIQVAYWRPNAWGSLEIDGREFPIPMEVIHHFRDVGGIRRLTTQPQIDIIKDELKNRDQYTRVVLACIADGKPGSRIVFLDPDTGLAPRKPGLQHVLESELLAFWRKMRDGDVLVFYQHQNRTGAPWVDPKLEQFERAIAVQVGSAKVARGPGVARDVAFFYCRKGSREPTRGAA